MRAQTTVQNISFRIDFRQGIEIDRETAMESGLTEGDLSYVYSHPELDVKMMIYPTGKAFVTGAKSREEVESCFWKLRSILKSIGSDVSLRPDTAVEIENVLATANIHDFLPGVEIDLEELALREDGEYDPESFPGVFIPFILETDDGVCIATTILFESGKVLIGDVRSHEDANLVLEKLIDAIRR